MELVNMVQMMIEHCREMNENMVELWATMEP
jgi:hypothetical protein